MDVRRTAAIAVWCLAGAALPATAGEIEGQVQLAGPVPQPSYVVVDRDQAMCGNASKRSESLIVSPEGFVQNAVVFVPDAQGDGEAAAALATLDQQRCEFVPHVVCVRQGAAVTFLNSDQGVHEGRCFREAEMLTRFTMPPKARPVQRTFEAPGPVLVRCGLHPWMHAWIYVAGKGRYTVTDTKGRFSLANVSPGTYQLHIWHETLGTHIETVNVGTATSRVAVHLSRQEERKP